VNDGLAVRLRAYLANRTSTVTYAQAARDMGGISINHLTQALEKMMEEDSVTGHPFLAARVISRTRPLPARGFFDRARALGRAVDDEAAFHAAELAALRRLP
jgi:NFU1 iron-sulfur cluster scaffold homolog, mitochondrial